MKIYKALVIETLTRNVLYEVEADSPEIARVKLSSGDTVEESLHTDVEIIHRRILKPEQS